MKILFRCYAILIGFSLPFSGSASEAQKILNESGVTGGLILQIGCGNGDIAAELHQSGKFVVHGLAGTAEEVKIARENLRRKGVYGPVSVEQIQGEQLPLNDDLVNLVVADSPHGFSNDEIMRVLCPNGVAMIKTGDTWQKTVKPRPGDIDDWTHYFHGPDGNAVAQDARVAPPTRLQWLGSPRWSRHHDRMASMSALVSGGGRLFYIMDEGSRVSIQLPSKWMLIARDAFNSKTLWKQPIKNWHDQLWPLKSGPTQLAKRLVTDGDRVFAPLALGASVSCLDAATGEILTTYDDTVGAEEMILVDGKLIVVSNPTDSWALKDFNVKLNTGDQGRVSKEFGWNEKPRQLSLIDTETGNTIWTKESKVAPLSLVGNSKQIIIHDGNAVISLDPANGNENWRNTEASRRSLFEFNFGPRLVVRDDVVLYAGGDGKKMGLNPQNGATLWSSGDPKSGYKSPQDLLVASGLVWTAPLTSGRDTGVFTGLDPLTGEVKKEFPPNVKTYWFHHRCYISKATEKYIMPSRTGIEFVDHEKQDWDINHWVRGGCLYGVMPANGLTYAPPHNCACYPEAKLFGFNALAASGSEPDEIQDEQRLFINGAMPALESLAPDPADWPTYRHDNERSGYTEQNFGVDLEKTWQAKIGEKLSAPTIANGVIYLSEIDAHTIHALDEKNGETKWIFTAGGRVDSPPTYYRGRAIFGCNDGNVYCLNAATGELIWRFHAAPSNRKTMVFEQLESLWPVPGSILVEEDGVASFVAGRSAFLDGGMYFYRLNVHNGEILVKKHINDRDPETGGDLQDRIQTLQMPVALNDILSSDGKYTYLRSQKIADDGTRVEIGPISGSAALHGGTQAGEGAHVFAPMGFLDDTWFHRSYWVYGRNFAGGHNGYYQAGKYAPAGRILVFDKENVYGYGREAKYLKWTTTLEHQLFSASRDIKDHSKAAAASDKKRTRSTGMPVAFKVTERINPANKPLTVETWVMADAKSGVILAHGGSLNGYALTIANGIPQFHVRADSQLTTAQGKKKLTAGWHHIAGVLERSGQMKLYIDGEEVGMAKSKGGLISKKPVQTLELAGDSKPAVGEYQSDRRTACLIDQMAIYHRALTGEEIRKRFQNPGDKPVNAAIACSFDAGNANDDTKGANHGVMSGTDSGKGIAGSALWIQRAKTGKGKGKGQGKGKTNLPTKNSYVEHHWAQRVPIYTRAMAMANDTLIIAGPPDIIDEEYTFERLANQDSSVHEQLELQDKALNGEEGAIMQLVSKNDGNSRQRLDLESLPVWDGMAVAQGKLFVCGSDGVVRCFAGK